MKEEIKEQQLKVELREPEAEGIYSNYSVIAFSNAEFIIDFIRILPGMQKTHVMSRIIMTPQSAKNLLMNLQGQIKRYEEQNGEIKIPESKLTKPIGFSTASNNPEN